VLQGSGCFTGISDSCFDGYRGKDFPAERDEDQASVVSITSWHGWFGEWKLIGLRIAE
jgi:hypothetical protein